MMDNLRCEGERLKDIVEKDAREEEKETTKQKEQAEEKAYLTSQKHERTETSV